MLRFVVWIGALLALLGACKPLDERLDPNPAEGLAFSDTAILFDTVFTTRKTITQRLRIYNPNAGTIVLEEVRMEGNAGQASPFSLTVNGRRGTVIQNVEILGKDSAWVLVSGLLPEARVDTPLIYQDKVLFRIRGRAEAQAVPVVAKGQDAVYLQANTTIRSDTTWRANKPIVLLGTVLVDTLRALTIEPGTRVHLFSNAFLVCKGALVAEGTYQRPIRFTGTRLESYYANVPGQWGYIGLLPGSEGSSLRHCIIENGLRGLQVGIPTFPAPISVQLDNVLIRNCSDVGLWGFNAAITGYNLVIADCGSSYIAGQMGGSYAFAHCTLAQSGNTPFNRRSPLVFFADFFQQDQNSPRLVGFTPRISFFNSILSGSQELELATALAPGGPAQPFDYSRVQNNLITGRRYPDLPTSNRLLPVSFFAPGGQFFRQPSSYDFRPDSANPGPAATGGMRITEIDDREPAFRPLPTNKFLDFVAKDRDANTPTLGAYERIMP